MSLAISALGRDFFARDPLVVAPEMLGMVLRVGSRAGRIVEVEAYRGADDPASHGFGGPTPRTEVMFGPPGHLYVYFSYGMHWCTNVVCAPTGTCGAVLIRALEPTAGVAEMYGARGTAARSDRDLCSGPAKLCQALGIDGDLDGLDLFGPDAAVRIEAGPRRPVHVVRRSPRIGIAVGRGDDLPWRFFVAGSAHLSRRERT